MIVSIPTWARANHPYDSINRCLDTIKAAGFDYADAEFWELQGDSSPLFSDSWETWANEVREYADSIGIQFYQAHGLSVSGMQWDDPSYAPIAEKIWKMQYRAIEAARILGVKKFVVHPANLAHASLYNAKKTKEYNIEFLSPYAEAAKKASLTLAIENMVDFRGNRRRYCGGEPEELMELVDAFNDDAIGICVDTGHANLTGLHAGDLIRLYGKRVCALHINDNFGKGDDLHLAPFEGTVDWADVVLALREIGYSDSFSYEISMPHKPKETFGFWLKHYRDLASLILGE